MSVYFKRFLPKPQGQLSITTELRWFYWGALPVAVENWFNQATLGRPAPGWERRKDVYLFIPAYHYLNLKLRENRLEVKLRLAQQAPQQFVHHWTGRIEQWTKWGCTGAALTDAVDASWGIPSDPTTQPVWIEVEKQRSQRHYQLSQTNQPCPLPLEKSVRQGCRVEVTRLKVKKQDWWSVAIEAFGEPQRQAEIVVAIAAWLSQIQNSPTLEAEQSFAYPAWLSQV